MRYVAEVEVPLTRPDAFDYLARFSSAAEWDPGVAEARQATPDPVGPGSRFDLVAVFLGNRVPMTYEITEYDRPRRVVLVAETSSVRSVDTISFDTTASGTRVTYDARLDFKGPARLLSPFLARVFKRVGDAAAAGLAKTVATPTQEGAR